VTVAIQRERDAVGIPCFDQNKSGANKRKLKYKALKKSETDTINIDSDGATGKWAVFAEGITKSYGYWRVLTGVCFKVAYGEHLVIIGRNGCGKTTLINILATLSRPNSGRIVIGSYDLKKETVKVRHKLGVVSHQSMLYSNLTVAENLVFYGRMYGVKDAKSRAGELITHFGLEKWRDVRVAGTSRGTQQRTALARALVHSPSILLLDEPDTGLDPLALEFLRDEIGNLIKRGAAVISTTHNTGFAADLDCRIALLSGGTIVFESAGKAITSGSIKTTFERYGKPGE
jgi:heme exporter protein A